MTTKNLGHLKVSLMHDGIHITDEARNQEEVAQGLAPNDPGDEIVLSLSNDFIVKTFLRPMQNGSATLEVHEGNITIHQQTDAFEVGVVPRPRFLQQQKNPNNPIAQNVSLDGYCLNLFLRTLGGSQKLNMSIDDVVGIIQAAFEEGVADLVQFNMDYCQDEDLCLNRLGPMIAQIKKQFRTFIALRGFPPKNTAIIDKFYASGVDLLNYPLQGFRETTDSTNPIPENRILQGLEYAAGIFPQGAVWTELDFIAEPREVAQGKIDQLAGMGVIPVLKLPDRGLDREEDFDLLTEVVDHLGAVSRKKNMTLKWLYPTCQFISPLDTSFYTTEGSRARLAVKPVYQSKIGKKASEGFASLRRRLRVKNISDSFESAGL